MRAQLVDASLEVNRDVRATGAAADQTGDEFERHTRVLELVQPLRDDGRLARASLPRHTQHRLVLHQVSQSVTQTRR